MERICRSCGQILNLKEKETYFRSGNGSKRSIYYCSRCADKPDEVKKSMWKSRTGNK